MITSVLEKGTGGNIGIPPRRGNPKMSRMGTQNVTVFLDARRQTPDAGRQLSKA
jgi:hypothetical protein